MKHILKKLGFIAYCFAICPCLADTLTEHRWLHRVLLVSSQSESETQAILGQLSNQTDSIQARKLRIYIADKRDIVTFPKIIEISMADNAEIRRTLAKNKVVLIGLDGSIKASYARLDINAIFEKIDSMPMRQAELKNFVTL